MAYSDKQKAKIKAEFEAGIEPILTIAKNNGMSRNTLKKFAKSEGWEYGKNDHELTSKIEAGTTKKLTERYSYELEDFTVDFIKTSKMVESLTKKTMADYAEKVKGGNLKQSDSNASLTAQRYLKEAASTISLLYDGKRKALGLDKEKSDTTVNVNNSPPQITLVGVKPDEPCPK